MAGKKRRVCDAIQGAHIAIRSRGWTSMPPEICRLILESLVADSVVSGASIALYASVCREWQHFFENITFRRLVLDNFALPTFRKVVSGTNVVRLNHIRHLWLRVKLFKYSADSCKIPESGTTIAQNNLSFTTSVRTLLKILSSWDEKSGGMTLEISIHSPSDAEHRFYLYQLEDNYPFRYEEDLSRQPSLLEYHRQKFAEVQRIVGSGRNAERRVWLSPREVKRVHGSPIQLRPRKLKDARGRNNSTPSLAKVTIVKGFLVRLQFFRYIAPEALAQMFKQSLVALEWFRLERWTAPTLQDEISFIEGFQKQVLPALPKSLQGFYFSHYRRWITSPSESALWNSLYSPLAKAMTVLCAHLKEFHSPWVVGTESFLRELGRTPRGWLNLERLSVQCKRLNSLSTQKTVTRLLVAAGNAANRMPNLRVMEIWHTGTAYAYFFCYIFDGTEAKLVWRSAGPDILSHERHSGSETFKVWADVAAKHTHRSLSMEIKPFDESVQEISKTMGSCLYKHLNLRRLAFDPITEEQIKTEILLSRNL